MILAGHGEMPTIEAANPDATHAGRLHSQHFWTLADPTIAFGYTLRCHIRPKTQDFAAFILLSADVGRTVQLSLAYPSFHTLPILLPSCIPPFGLRRLVLARRAACGNVRPGICSWTREAGPSFSTNA